MNPDEYTRWRDVDAKKIEAEAEFVEADERPEDDTQADQAEVDPMDDPDFRAAARGQRELSGNVANNGRRRGNHPTGVRGQGIRGLRYVDGPAKAPIRPTGRRLGGRSPVVGRPSYEDAPELVADLLGKRRTRVLQEGLTSRGADAEERDARAYLAAMLTRLDSTAANKAAAELLLGASGKAELRKVGDLRRKAYASEVEAKAERDLRSALGRRNNVRS